MIITNKITYARYGTRLTCDKDVPGTQTIINTNDERRAKDYIETKLRELTETRFKKLYYGDWGE